MTPYALIAATLTVVIHLILYRSARARSEPPPPDPETAPRPRLMPFRGYPLPGAPLRFLASRVYHARLRSGARVLDAADFRQWLLEMAEQTDNAA